MSAAQRPVAPGFGGLLIFGVRFDVPPPLNAAERFLQVIDAPEPPTTCPLCSAADRLRVVSAMLPGLQLDIAAGRYGLPGRPNVTSIMHVVHEPAAVLEPLRGQLERIVAEAEAKR